jgi:peptidoglycan hydrolase-like protein with peptidoglycan-binding domain
VAEPAAPAFTTRIEGRETVAEAQRLLHALGYDAGPANGVLGPRMRRAIAAFQRNNGLGPDGRMTRALVVSLRKRHR